jgi:predicted metal-dependent hydrolase
VDVEVIRSARRRKTVSARTVEGVLQVRIPDSMSPEEEARWVAEMTRRVRRRQRSDGVDLAARARLLARRHGLPEPSSIRWVDDQRTRWGSCTPADGTVRLSSRLAGFPPWVVDFVVVHELAHLVEAGHGPAFQALVARYPRAERATGFLLAMGLAPEEG